MSNKKFYMTTAIAYTSGKPHIGNTYEFVLADAIARYKRSQGYDVFFQTGTDEHGQKIENVAKDKGVSPQEFVNEIAEFISGSTEGEGAASLVNRVTTNEQNIANLTDSVTGILNTIGTESDGLVADIIANTNAISTLEGKVGDENGGLVKDVAELETKIGDQTVAAQIEAAIEGILCRADSELSLTGFNMETAITYKIDAEITDTGCCVLPARLFGDIIRRLPEGPVTVSVDSMYKVSIRSGYASFNISAENADDYPELPDVGEGRKIMIPQKGGFIDPVDPAEGKITVHTIEAVCNKVACRCVAVSFNTRCECCIAVRINVDIRMHPRT